MTQDLKIIIVEDSDDDAVLIRRKIRKGGYRPTIIRVDSASSRRIALAEKDWDLVLSDHAMPGFSAAGALRVIKECGVKIPFITVTGEINEETADSLFRNGSVGLVLKDELDRLVSAIDQVN